MLPQSARRRLGLTPGARFDCRVKGSDIILTPQSAVVGKPQLVRDKLTGMIVTKASAGSPRVTSEQIRELLSDFP